MRLFYDFLSLKNNVNVPEASKRNKQNNFKKIIFSCSLEGH
jgi:hypothetical protein